MAGAALLAVALAFALAPRPAAADPMEADRVDVETLDLAALLDLEVQAVSRHGERESAAPAWVFVLGAEDLRRLRPRTLHDVLRTVPGLFAYADGLYPLVGVRGVGLLADYSTRLLVLVDGHPLNNSVGIGQSYLGEDFPVPLSAVRRIEVIEGPVGSVYGPTAFLGLVNVVTHEAGAQPTTGALSAEAAGRLTAGTVEGAAAASAGRVHLSAAARAAGGPGGTWRFPELALDPDRAPPPGLRVRDADASRALSAYARATWRALELQTACGAARRGVPSAPYSALVGDDRTWLENRTCWAQLGWRRLLEAGEVGARVAYDAFRFRDAFAYAPPPDDVGVYRDDAYDRWLSAEVRGEWHPSASSLLAGGVAGEAHETLQHVYADLPGFGVGPIEKDFRTLNAWLVGEGRLGERVRVNGALTWHAHEMYGARLTPKLAAVVRASPQDVVKLVYSEGFRPPTMAEAYYEDNTDFLANPGLRPEHTRSYEAIWERRVGAVASLSLSAFRTEHHDLVEFVTVPAPGLSGPPDPAVPSDWRQQGRNVGVLRSRGAQLGFTLRLTRGTVAWGGVAIQEPEGRRPPNFPAVTASATVSTRWPWRPLALTASAAALSARRKDATALSPGARPEVPAAAVLSLAALLDVPAVPGLTVELAVRGLGAGRLAHPVSGDFAPITEIPEPATSVVGGLRFTR